MDVENQDQIPVEILRALDGKWIAWDEEDRCVLGVGETFEEAEDDANAKGSKHMLRFHHANWLNHVPAPAEHA